MRSALNIVHHRRRAVVGILMTTDETVNLGNTDTFKDSFYVRKSQCYNTFEDMIHWE